MKLPESARALYFELNQKISNPRQRQSFERTSQACDYLFENHIKIGPTSIERYCIDRGWEGPKSQSIRNSQSILMVYVEHCHALQQWPSKRRKEKTGRPQIADASLRAYVQLIEDERDLAIAEKTRIVASIRSMPALKIDDVISQQSDAESPEVRQFGPRLPADLTAGIRLLLDKDRLAACGLAFERSRVLQLETGNVLLEKAHVEAIQAILGTLAQASN